MIRYLVMGCRSACYDVTTAVYTGGVWVDDQRGKATVSGEVSQAR